MSLDKIKAGQGKFSDFAKLRVGGRDQYSAIGLAKLETMVSSEALQTIRDHQLSATDQAAALRWILRGLSPLDAITKIQVGKEIGQNARAARNDDYDDWED